MTTAAEIRVALKEWYPAPEWAILFEVSSATGSGSRRYADAVAMSLWPSRGLTVHGMEIKVSRSDWRKERSMPEKAERIAAYCDYWTLVTAKGVIVDIDEIPPAWGWLEYSNGKFIRRKEDVQTESKPIDRSFLAALMRSIHGASDAVIDEMVRRRSKIFEEQFQTRVESHASRLRIDGQAAIRTLARFEEESGMKLGNGWSGNELDPARAGQAVRAIMAAGIDESYRGMFDMAHILRNAAEKIDAAMIEQGFTPPQVDQRGKKPGNGRARR